jgi:hypothetical protein
MSLADSFRQLAHRFQEGHRRWPALRHTLLEAVDEKGQGSLARFDLGSFVRVRGRSNDGGASVRTDIFGSVKYADLFHWDSHHTIIRGVPSEDEAFRSLDLLAGVALRLLSDAGKLPAEGQRTSEILDTLLNRLDAGNDTRRFMVFVHRLAQENRHGSLLRVKVRNQVGDEPLPEGVVAFELSVGVFDAAALALETVAQDIKAINCDDSENQRNEQDNFITFEYAKSLTALRDYEITRACNSGKVRFIGKGKGRLVHAADLAKFVTDRQKTD